MLDYCVGTSVWHRAVAAAVFFALTAAAGTISVTAQTPPPRAPAISLDWLKPVPQFPLAASDLTIHQHAEAGKPFTVAGPCGAVMGDQNGTFEAWVFPVKLLSHFSIGAEVEGYPVPIDLNADAAAIEVAPDHTTITYAHTAFTVRETFYATRCASAADAGAGIVALFQIDSIRPVKLTFNFTPEVRRMWPVPNYGPPGPEWVGTAAGGYYLLHEDFPDLAGAIAMPGTRPGILAPFQEKPKTYPLQLILDFDPKRDSGKYFPLTMAVGMTAATATNAALTERLASLNNEARQLYEKTAAYYDHFFDTRLVAETPDRKLNAALRWAEISIDQVQVRHGEEVGLVAGFFSSGDSARPGFGWFFGRDTLYTLYAVNSYGDFALTREALNFLIERQREDGKMPHEWSQTADLVDWKSFPYEYAAADATPLFLMAMEDYVDASGDLAYLRTNWAAIEKAWNFEVSHDTDGDGIYDNSQGTGWVENWDPFTMPHQEIYLAALDQQASGAMARLSRRMGQSATAAETRAASIAAKVEQEYYGDGLYAFSRAADGTLDKTATMFPMIAWWDGHYALKQPEAMFRRWDSAEFSTDWGLRDVGDHERIFDPISYHQGPVWPLFTGWGSIAEYRTGRPLSGYAHLMQNAGLTWEQDLGAVTELLSGAYFVPFGRSTTHQMWSSAMVITPAIRGLFGLTFDAEDRSILVDPHLPPEWEGATLRHVPVAGGMADISFHREGRTLVVSLTGAPAGVGLRSKATLPLAAKGASELRVPLASVEVGVPAELPLPGAATSQLKVVAEKHLDHSVELELEGQAGTSYDLPVRLNGITEKQVAVTGGELHPAMWAAAAPRLTTWWAEGGSMIPHTNLDQLHGSFAAGNGYRRQTVVVKW